MKANEAPEKFYLLPNGFISYFRNSDEDIEYTRTDAFIEKVYDWITQHIEDAIAWLEKQGEIGEDLIAKKYLINKGYPIDANGTFPTFEEMYNIIREGLEKQSEKKPQRMISAEAKEAMYDKPVWSEEDKDFMYDTLSNLTELKDRYGEGYGNVGKCIDWLKSLKKE